ncbi:hypothetical protein AMK06_CH02290 [Rhizobium sp. N541]|nr:hypothetical protein AMK06_CH02290 [Rhizobium sp. N541]ANM23569.1 hypothetical protein AMK07_CH02287 [Rhizobium sp. N941]
MNLDKGNKLLLLTYDQQLLSRGNSIADMISAINLIKYLNLLYKVFNRFLPNLVPNEKSYGGFSISHRSVILSECPRRSSGLLL